VSVPATVTNKKPQVAKRLVGYLIKKYENGVISRSEFDCKIIYKHKKNDMCYRYGHYAETSN
jgi:hypothetical protein